MTHKKPDHSHVLVLTQGNMICTTEVLRVATVLGSCIAVSMHCSNPRAGALCHAVLARPGAKHDQDAYQRHPYRYVSTALPTMLAFFKSLGADPVDIEVKLFGGAEGVSLPGSLPTILQVGRANVAEAEELLARLGLSILRSHTGGSQARKIIFDTGSGEVLLKLLLHEELTHSTLHAK